MVHPLRVAVAAAAFACALPVHAVGLTVDQLSLAPAQKEALNQALKAPSAALVSPGFAFGSPVGFGLNLGQGAVGIGGQTVPKSFNNTGDVDGSAGVALGLGDSASSLGLEVTFNIVSLRDNFADSGSFNIKAHRMVGERTSVAFGTESQFAYGDAREAKESYYGVVTTVLDGPFSRPLVVNLGAGNERFREHASGFNDTPGIFGGLAYVVHEQVSLIADYTGLDLNAAVSVVPFKRLPLTVTLGMINLTEEENRDSEFSGAVGYSFNF